MKNLAPAVVPLLSFLFAPTAFAAGGIPQTISYYEMVLDAFHANHQWVPTVGALFCTLVIIVIGLRYKAAVAASAAEVRPSGDFSMRFVIESILDFVHGIAKDNCGHGFRKFFPFLSALFIFILTCNLSGLVPGFPPPTESMDTNVAMGIFVFLVYNIAGFKEQGAVGYFKHFLGPVAAIAPLYFAIEMVSHGSRPLSLGLRLAGNIFGDHTLLGVFTSLSYIVLPALLMFLGLLVAVVQSFVFTLLTGIYISLAISHDH